jgi:hypothetical protein
MSGMIESIPQRCPKNREKKLNRFVMFMCYSSWLSLRINIKISGFLGSKNSRDSFKEWQASMTALMYLLGNLMTVFFVLDKHIKLGQIIRNIASEEGTQLAIMAVPFVIVFCLGLWIINYEDDFHSMFEKFSKPLKKKWDRLLLSYWGATWALLVLVIFVRELTG